MGLDDRRLIEADAALARVKMNGHKNTDLWVLISLVLAAMFAVFMFITLTVQNAKLTEAVADKNNTIAAVQEVVDHLEIYSQRSQCFFDLIAERQRALEVGDSVTASDLLQQYRDGMLCPVQIGDKKEGS